MFGSRGCRGRERRCENDRPRVSRAPLGGPAVLSLSLVVLSLLLLTGCSDGFGGDEPTGPQTPSEPEGGQKPETGIGDTSTPVARGNLDCLTTPNGIPRKVIVKNADASAYPTPDFSGPGNRRLKFFRKYFIFDEDMTKGYRVGEATRQDSVLGWVRNDDVMPWNHALAVYFINKDSEAAAPVRVWMNREDVGDPNSPYFEEDLRVGHTTEPFPILDKDGSLVRIAFLWKSGEDTRALDDDRLRARDIGRAPEGKELEAGAASQARRRLAEGVQQMDIMLVMDCTSSMRPYMDQVRTKMLRLVRELHRIGGADSSFKTRIGVVAYRDYADHLTSFTTRLLDLTDSEQAVQEFLEELKPYSEGRGRNEAVFEGLSEALEGATWNPHSYKVLCLVGDAPPHHPDDVDTRWAQSEGIRLKSDCLGRSVEENVGRIHETLQRRRIRFYALGVGGDREMEADFRRLASIEGWGKFLSLADEEAFIAVLKEELEESRRDHRETSERVEGILAQGETAVEQVFSEEDQYALLVHNIDLGKLAALQRSRVQTGWFDVNDVLDRVMVCSYMTRSEFEDVLSDLFGRFGDGDSSASLDDQLPLLIDTVRPYIGDAESLRGIQSIDDLLTAIKDIPIPPEIFERVYSLTNHEIADIIRRKRDYALMILYNDETYNAYNEGWIPIDLLPGAVS